MSPFLNAVLISQVQKAFNYICKSDKPKLGEQILSKYRNHPEWNLILCMFLDSSQKTSENSMKILAALQLKTIEHINQQQCWWIISHVYLNESQKLSRIVKDIFLKPHNIQYLRPLLTLNFKGKGQGQKIRILQLFFCLIFNKSQQIAKQFVSNYCADIFESLNQIGSDYNQFQIVAQLTMMNLLGLLSSCKIYGLQFQKDELKRILQGLQCKSSNAITITIEKIIKLQLNFQLGEPIDPTLIEASIHKCLKQTARVCSFGQNQFYFNLLNIMNTYFFVQKIPQDQNFISKILRNYSFHIKNRMSKAITSIQQDSVDQQQKHPFKTKQIYLILQSILLQSNVLITKNILEQFEINMLQFALVVPSWAKSKNLNQIYLINLCRMTKTMSRDYKQQINDKQIYTICIICKYIAKYSSKIPIQFLLQICYWCDQIALKYEPLSEICYQVIQILTPWLLSIQSYKLLEFLNFSVKNINNNIWGHSAKSYLFVFKLLFNIDEQYWLNCSNELNRNLSAMLEVLVDILKNSYDHEVMHNLRAFLHILNNRDKFRDILFNTSKQSLEIIQDLINKYEQPILNQTNQFQIKFVPNQNKFKNPQIDLDP